MLEPLYRATLSFLKVPPEPHPPIGDPASLRVFRAGQNYYRLRVATWMAAQVIALGAFVFWTAILVGVEKAIHERNASVVSPASTMGTAPGDDPAANPPGPAPAEAPRAGNWIERGVAKIQSAAEKVAPDGSTEQPRGIGGWIAGYTRFFVEVALLLPEWIFSLLWIVKIASFSLYLLQIPLTFAVRRLDYEMRWYMVTDRSLRLRHGVWKVTESTMSFANIQQVSMIQGPVQRLLGLSDVKVQSAGGGRSLHHEQHAGEDMHVGLFRHVTNAPEIRDLVLERLRRFRESGLGDPEEKSNLPSTDSASVPAAASSPADAVAAAKELLAEAKALRAALA